MDQKLEIFQDLPEMDPSKLFSRIKLSCMASGCKFKTTWADEESSLQMSQVYEAWTRHQAVKGHSEYYIWKVSRHLGRSYTS